jgi:hypothetical protein
LKQLIPLLFPLSLFAQEKHIAAGAILSHDTRGGYAQMVWQYDRVYGSMGLEVLTFRNPKLFVPLTFGVGYSFGVPFIQSGFGAGINTAGQYGALAEIGAGVKAGFVQLQVMYRGAAMPVNDQDGSSSYGQGVMLKVGVGF